MARLSDAGDRCIAHCGGGVGAPDQLLNCPNRRAAHRKVRAEGVAQDVDTAGQRQPSAGLRSLHPASQRVGRDEVPVPFQELRDRAHPFTDAIADDQQQEIAAL